MSNGTLNSTHSLTHSLTHSGTHSPVVVVLSVFKAGDVSFPQQQFLVFDDKQRSTDSSGVSVDADLTIANVTYHRHLRHTTTIIASARKTQPTRNINNAIRGTMLWSAWHCTSLHYPHNLQWLYSHQIEHNSISYHVYRAWETSKKYLNQ